MGNSGERLKYPIDEAKYDWLPILLDAYHIADTGIASELKKGEVKRKTKVTCQSQCSNCCLRPVIPVTELELWGISWFASEKLQVHVRLVIKEQLLHHRQTPQCPFLFQSICSIYPVRPLACREFFMFGLPCKSNEHVEMTRPNDIWCHSRELARRIAIVMLPYYGIKDMNQKIEAFKNGYIANISQPMHQLPLERFASTM